MRTTVHGIVSDLFITVLSAKKTINEEAHHLFPSRVRAKENQYHCAWKPCPWSIAPYNVILDMSVYNQWGLLRDLIYDIKRLWHIVGNVVLFGNWRYIPQIVYFDIGLWNALPIMINILVNGNSVISIIIYCVNVIPSYYCEPCSFYDMRKCRGIN